MYVQSICPCCWTWNTPWSVMRSSAHWEAIGVVLSMKWELQLVRTYMSVFAYAHVCVHVCASTFLCLHVCVYEYVHEYVFVQVSFTWYLLQFISCTSFSCLKFLISPLFNFWHFWNKFFTSHHFSFSYKPYITIRYGGSETVYWPQYGNLWKGNVY
jgi:hypothetical protein